MTQEKAYFEDLMSQRRYAAIRDGITSDDPHLVALRKDADYFFATGVTKASEIYESQCGSQSPTNDAQREAVRSLFREKVGAIDDLYEAESYARALVDEAEQLANTRGSRESLCVRAWAAHVLCPPSSALIERIDRLIAPQEKKPRSSGRSRSRSKTVLLSSEGDTDGKGTKKHNTRRTIIAPDQQDSTIVSSDDSAEQINRLGAMLQEPHADLPAAHSLLESLRSRVVGSAHADTFARLERQYKQRQNLFPRLYQFLDRPVSDWLSDPIIQRQAQHMLDDVEDAFGSNTTIFAGLLERYNQRIGERHALTNWLNNLKNLHGSELSTEIQQLEALVGADHPLLHEARQRTSTSPLRDTGTLVMEEKDDSVFDSLQAIAAMLRERRTALNDIRNAIDAVKDQAQVSPHQAFFAKLERQYEARRQLPRLDEELLLLPIRAWLEDPDIMQEAQDLLVQLDVVFGRDVPLFQQVAQIYDQRISGLRSIKARLNGLAHIEGANLVSELLVLEKELGADYPGLRAAQQRRKQYEEQQWGAQQEEVRARWQQELQQLRREIDAELNSYDPKDAKLKDFLTKAENAVGLSLPEHEHPLDAETLAYYRVLIHDWTHSLQDTQLETEGRTSQSNEELIKAVAAFRKNLAELASSDDQRAKRKAEGLLNDAYEKLKLQLPLELRRKLEEIKEQLKRYDYAAALATLLTEQTNIHIAQTEGGVEVDSSLQTELADLLNEARRLEDLGKKAEALRQQAEQEVMEDREDRNYPQAVAYLEEAVKIAPWLQNAFQERITKLCEQQRKFMASSLALANTYRSTNSFDIAEKYLERARINATDDYRTRIEELHADIITQKRNAEIVGDLRESLKALGVEARKGEAIDELHARIARQREKIGAKDHPRFGAEDWSELDSLLRTAEAYVQAWVAYRKAKNEAENAAFGADKEQVEQAITTMRSMSQHDFLPIQQDIAQIRSIAGSGTLADWARSEFEHMIRSLTTGEVDVSVETMNRLVQATASLTGSEYADIVKNRAFVAGFLPLYNARTRLSGYVQDRNFQQVLDDYATLPADVQSDREILRCKQDAERAIASEKQEAEVRKLFSQVQTAFDHGWSNPSEFQATVEKLTMFAAQADPSLRSKHPRLADEPLTLLRGVAQNLVLAKDSHMEQQHDQVWRTIDTIQRTLAKATFGQELACYETELAQLKRSLTDVKGDCEKKKQERESAEAELERIRKRYRAEIDKNEVSFQEQALRELLKEFENVENPAVQTQAQRFMKALSAILATLHTTQRLDEVLVKHTYQDETLQEMIHRLQDLAAGEPDLEKSLDSLRKDIEQEIATSAEQDRPHLLDRSLVWLRQSSTLIKRTEQGRHWPGIEKSPVYAFFSEHADIAQNLARIETWLNTTITRDLSEAELNKLAMEGEACKKILASCHHTVKTWLDDRHRQQRSADAQERDTTLDQLLSYCDEHGNLSRMVQEHVKRIASSIGLLETQKHEKSRSRFWLSALVALVLMVIVAWNIPPVQGSVRENVFPIFFGTPVSTPTVAPTPDPSMVGTATPTPDPNIVMVTVTPTPVPTATPVPPQPGKIIFPESFNAHEGPSLDTPRVGFVRSGDDMEMTGYTDDPDGARWYRVKVPDRGITSGWLPAKRDYKGEEKDMIYLNGAEPDSRLGIPYEDAR